MYNKTNEAKALASITVALIFLSVLGAMGNSRLILSGKFFASADSAYNVAQYNETVPSSYQSMYSTLNQILTNFNQTLASTQSQSSQQTMYATELLPADSNLGENLLAPNAMQGVINYLNALQELGVQGVTIDVSYPILVSSFQNYTQYLSFYENVVSQVRQRGMKIDIESETPILVGYPGISVDNLSYANLTYSEYVSQDKQMLQTVINDLQPDYLNIGTEVSTLQELLNFSEISTPQGWGAYISSLLNGLNKGSTKIAVGIGTWDSIAYLDSTINNTAIDVINVHIYPVYGDYLSVLTQIGQLSTEYNKPINIDEMWLHKSVTNEGATFEADASIRQRNVYAFWIPLDEEFLNVMALFAQKYNVTYMSPFEGNQFFAYLNYSAATANLTYQQAEQLEDQATSQNEAANTFSPLGAFYQNLITTSSSAIPTPQPTLTPTVPPSTLASNTPAPAPTVSSSPTLPSSPTNSPAVTMSPTPSVSELTLASITLVMIIVLVVFAVASKRKNTLEAELDPKK